MRRRPTARGGRDRRRAAAERDDLVFIARAEHHDPVVVELDRPMAFRPRPVGFWWQQEFYRITRIITTRREHDVTYHRVVTDRGAFDLCYIRRMDPITLRARRRWELWAELDAIPVARLG
jgi:hypothetical protein